MSDEFGILWEGGDRFLKSLEEWETRMVAASRSGVSDAAHLVQKAMQDKANTGRHKIGEPTSAVQGAGPNVVTGNLRRSIRVGPIVPAGKGFATEVGPTAIYGRRIELEYGYPYAGPGFEAAIPELHEVFAAAWARGMR